MASGKPSNIKTNSRKKCIFALKKLQVEHTSLKIDFYKELLALERKYAELLAPLYMKRNAITSSEVDLTKEDCEFPYDECETVDDSKSEDSETQEKTQIGIPRFWMTALKNADGVTGIIKKRDTKILKYLNDVKVIFCQNPSGFTLEFHFNKNEFFTNSILTKMYETRLCIDEKYPFTFNGAEFISSKGCAINWKDGKDNTAKKVRKKIKTISGYTYRRCIMLRKSFFNFFSSIEKDTIEDKMSNKRFNRLQKDFDIGYFVAKGVVPRAVLFYTGESDYIFKRGSRLLDDKLEDSASNIEFSYVDSDVDTSSTSTD